MSSFEDFQKIEYEHIAEAHFKALEAIATFFRYYLVVMTLPVPVLAVLMHFDKADSATTPSLQSVLGFVWLFFMSIGAVGFCILMYIINMKMDVVLYSRVVNSIRKYFYDAHDAEQANKLLMRQLPQTAYAPPYHDVPFAFVVGAFAIMDCLYFAFGAHVLFVLRFHSAPTWSDFNPMAMWPEEMVVNGILIGVVFCAHLIGYWSMAQFRENQYLRSRAIGVDIDGVLNLHREQFCKIAQEKFNKPIRPEEIRLLPVHENVDLTTPISRDEERAIFDDPRYWVEMPPFPSAGEVLGRIGASFMLPVHIFTSRPWPSDSAAHGADKTVSKEVRRKWRAAGRDMAARAGARWFARVWVDAVTFCSYRSAMRFITRYWLRAHNIGFNSLLVERGNEDMVYSRGRWENRFNYAKRKKIRFFVEDDWIKAVKLSYICDVVFLIDHPYNVATGGDVKKHHSGLFVSTLPGNVVRVRTWPELKRAISQLV